MDLPGGWPGGNIHNEFWNKVCARGDIAEDDLIKDACDLLSRGAAVNTERNFQHDGTNFGIVSAVFVAIVLNRTKLAECLIGKPGVRLEHRYSPYQWTVLHQAVMKGQIQVVKAILREAGIASPLGSQDSHGRTALHYAAEAACAEMALLLLSSGALVDAPDIDGLTPLHLLVWNAGYNDGARVIDTAECLFDYGADPNTQDRYGDRPIHDAARMILSNGSSKQDQAKRQLGEDLVRILLEHDADLNAENHDEETPRDLFRNGGKADDDLVRRIFAPTLLPAKLDAKLVCGPGRESTCREFEALVGLFGEEKKLLLKSVYDLVYDDNGLGPENNDQLTSDGKPVKWRWVHFPSNNMIWIQDYVWRLTESWGPDMHARKDWVRRTLKESTRKRKQTTPISWIRVPHASHVWPMKKLATAGAGPLGRDPIPDPPNDEAHHHREGYERGSAGGGGVADSNLLSIVIPFLDFEGQDFLDYRDKELHELLQAPEGAFEKKKVQQLHKLAKLQDRYPMLERQDGVQKLETLDEFYYDVLTLESLRERDRDQVIWRWLSSRVAESERASARKGEAPALEDKFPSSRRPRKTGKVRKETPKILMAHQLWIWKLDERTVITALPERWHTGREKTLLDLIRDNCVSSATDPDAFIESVLAECVYFLDRYKEAGVGEHILDIFGGFIALESHAEVRCFSGLAKYLERNGKTKPLYDATDGRRPRTEPMDNIKLEGESPKSIVEEFRIARNLKDLIDELRTIEHMFKTQETVIRAYSSIASPKSSPGRPLESWSVEGHLEKTQTLSGEAKKILADLDRIIQVKQAAFAADEAAKSLKLNAYIMTFTIVTIIFTPLSFMTSLFTVNLDWYPRDAEGAVSFPDQWIINHMITGEFISLVVILLFAVTSNRIQRAVRSLVKDGKHWRHSTTAWFGNGKRLRRPRGGDRFLEGERESVGDSKEA